MNFVKIVMSQETTTLSAGFLFFFNDLTKITLSLSLRGSKYNIIYSTLFSFSKENFLLVLCNLNMCVYSSSLLLQVKDIDLVEEYTFRVLFQVKR